MPSLPAFDSNESVEPTYKAVSENGVEDLKKYFKAEEFDFTLPPKVKKWFESGPSKESGPERLAKVVGDAAEKAVAWGKDQTNDANDKFAELGNWAQKNPLLAGGTFLGTAALGGLLALMFSGGRKKARGGRKKKPVKESLEKRTLADHLADIDEDDVDFDEFTEYLATLLESAE